MMIDNNFITMINDINRYIPVDMMMASVANMEVTDMVQEMRKVQESWISVGHLKTSHCWA